MATAAPRRRTQLDHYPRGGQRFASLAIVVLATVVLYYQFYLAGAVAAGTNGKNGILVDYHMSFVYYVNIAVVGYVLGAAASFAAGLADRYGRVNLITSGLVVVALLCLVGIPLADSKIGFAIVFALIGLVEGMILVATPALIRDFSPQLGRASAMGFWTLGPVLGSLVVSIQVSSTSNSTPWHHQYVAAGIVGLVVAALSALFLRELSPALRDQVMVSANDRALVEARAAGIDVEAAQKQPFRQMLKPDIVLSAFSISVFLIIYYVAVGFFPVYFQTIFHYSQSKANGLGNYVWAFDAGALILIGYLSDKVRVRKPFMVVGAVGAIVMTIVFLTRATHPGTSYSSFVIILSLLAVFLGVTYAPWMASFTETVEKRNPALAATGLAVWGLVIRIVIAVSVFIVPHVVTTVSTLVDHGAAVQAGAVPGFNDAENATVKAVAADPSIATKVQAIAAKYPKELATAQKLDTATATTLAVNPTDQAAGLKAASEVSGVDQADVRTLSMYQTQLATAQKLDPSTALALFSDPTNQAAGLAAVSQVSGVSVADVKTIAGLNAQYATGLQAAAVIDPTTRAALLKNAQDFDALEKAVKEISKKLGISIKEAEARLATLSTIPSTKLTLLLTSGPKVADAQSQLMALSKVPTPVLTLAQTSGQQVSDAQSALEALGKVPVADLATVQQYAPLAEPKVQKILTDVSSAANRSPKQWRNYYWIAVGGMIVFIPLIWLLAGAWSPSEARRREEEHEALVMAELKRLNEPKKV